MLVLEHKQHFCFNTRDQPHSCQQSSSLGFSTSSELSSLGRLHTGLMQSFRTEWCVSVRAQLWAVRKLHTFPSCCPQKRPISGGNSIASGLPSKSSRTKTDMCWWEAVLWDSTAIPAGTPAQGQLQLGCESSNPRERLKLPLAVVTGTWNDQQSHWVRT